MEFKDEYYEGGIISREDFDDFVLRDGLLPSEAAELEQKLSVEPIEFDFKDLDKDNFEERYKDIDDDSGLTSIRIYKKEVTKIPLLTADEERDLSYLVHNSPDQYTKIKARNTLVEHNLRYALWMAYKFKDKTSGSFGLEDLIQVCNQGLMYAAEMYDASRGCKFSSYSYYCIRSYITRNVAEIGYSVKLPTAFPAKFNHLKLAQDALYELYGDEPPIMAVVKECNREYPTDRMTVQQAQEILKLFPSAISMESPMYIGEDDEYTKREEQLSNDEPLIQEVFEDIACRDALFAMMDKVLNPREKAMVRARYGLDTGIEEKFRVLGERYGVSSQRASEIVARAIEKLRKEMLKKKFDEMLGR